MRKIAFSILASLAAMSVVSPANADVAVFSLSVVDPASGLGSGPFGTVTVTENLGGTLTFVETLLAGYRIHDGNANHNAFAFSIIGDPAVTVSGLTGGFTAINVAAGSNVSAPPFADFYTGIDCSSVCGPGYGGGFAGPLTFTVSASSALTLASLRSTTYAGNNIYFASDLVNANGLTGNVGATLVRGPVPEPGTWAMMLLGFGGVGVAMRRRRKSTSIAQLA